MKKYVVSALGLFAASVSVFLSASLSAALMVGDAFHLAYSAIKETSKFLAKSVISCLNLAAHWRVVERTFTHDVKVMLSQIHARSCTSSLFSKAPTA